MGFIKDNQGAIGAALNLASNIYTTEAQKKEAQRQRDWNESMMDKQNQFNVDMWNMNNEYNSPDKQRQRLIDAGINPLASSMSNSPSTQVSSAGVGSASMPQITNPMQGVLEPLMMEAQIDAIKANTKKTQVETDLSSIALQYQVDTYGNRLKASDFELEGMHLNNEKTKTEIAKVQNDIDMSIKNYELELDKFDFNKEQFDWQKAQDLINNYFESQKIDLATKQYALQCWNTAIQSKLADANIGLIMANTGRVEIQNDRDRAQLEADKPLMKANAYIDSGLRVVDGLFSVVNIGNLIKGKGGKTTTTRTIDSKGNESYTNVREDYD